MIDLAELTPVQWVTLQKMGESQCPMLWSGSRIWTLEGSEYTVKSPSISSLRDLGFLSGSGQQPAVLTNKGWQTAVAISNVPPSLSTAQKTLYAALYSGGECRRWKSGFWTIGGVESPQKWSTTTVQGLFQKGVIYCKNSDEKWFFRRIYAISG